PHAAIRRMALSGGEGLVLMFTPHYNSPILFFPPPPHGGGKRRADNRPVGDNRSNPQATGKV
ncbi:MAG: hypothetical protein LUH63_15765, partial [Parabacteroides sp.]|nr:hypothetical protein [Parabacteroides sp.]